MNCLKGKGKDGMGKKVLQNAVAAVLVIAAFLVGGCGLKASSYSEEQHIKRVTKRVEKRYMGEGSEYTGFEVFPLYDENEELKFFLVEFEPQGFVYVKLNEYNVKMCAGPGMYSREETEGQPWSRYTIEEGIEVIPKPDKNGTLVLYPDRRWETDENGNFIDYWDSHFKVAGIENERRYFITIDTLESIGKYGYVPSVKRGDRFLNLISMQNMDLSLDTVAEKYVVSDVHFQKSGILDL